MDECQYSKENSSFEKIEALFEKEKTDRQPNSFIKSVVYSSNKYHSKSPYKGKKKEYTFPQECQKDKSFQTLSPSLHLDGWARHIARVFPDKTGSHVQYGLAQTKFG